MQESSAEALMANAGKTFYRAARLLPAGVRAEVVALYAFCRRVDDLADEGSYALQERQVALRALAGVLERGEAQALAAVGWPFAAQGAMPAAAALLVRAALGDLQQRQPETMEELLSYAFGVAGTVGVMMAQVLRAAPEGVGAAVALGMAMQLSNICRDVAEDLQAGRVYLPREWVEREQVCLAVEKGEPNAAALVEGAMRRLLEVAAQLYEAAFDGIWSLPWRLRWSILAAGMCYREIGVAAGGDVAQSWRRRTVVSSGRKLWLIGVAGLRLLLPRFWRRPGQTAWPRALGQVAAAQGRALGVLP